MDRRTGFELIATHCDFPLRRHLAHVAQAMEALAAHYRLEPEETETWYLTGLLHDVDWNRTIHDPEKHCGEETMAMLESRGVSGEIREAIRSHYDFLGVPRDTALKKAIFCCDEISGFCVAAALMRPTKMIGMQAKSVTKKMKDRRFAEAVSREDMKACESLLEIPLNDFLAILLPAFERIAPQWELA